MIKIKILIKKDIIFHCLFQLNIHPMYIDIDII